MDELKEIYNIELTENDKKLKLIGLLIQKHNEVNNSLSLVTYRSARIALLELKEALEWEIERLQK